MDSPIAPSAQRAHSQGGRTLARVWPPRQRARAGRAGVRTASPSGRLFVTERLRTEQPAPEGPIRLVRHREASRVSVSTRWAGPRRTTTLPSGSRWASPVASHRRARPSPRDSTVPTRRGPATLGTSPSDGAFHHAVSQTSRAYPAARARSTPAIITAEATPRPRYRGAVQIEATRRSPGSGRTTRARYGR